MIKTNKLSAYVENLGLKSFEGKILFYQASYSHMSEPINFS